MVLNQGGVFKFLNLKVGNIVKNKIRFIFSLLYPSN